MNWKIFVILIIALTVETIHGLIITSSSISEIQKKDQTSCRLQINCQLRPSGSCLINGKSVCDGTKNTWYVDVPSQGAVPVSIKSSGFFRISVIEKAQTCSGPGPGPEPVTGGGNCATFAAGISGLMKSPNFPNPYGNNLNCLYNFPTKPGYCSVSINIKLLDLEAPPVCTADFVKLGNSKLCGPNDAGTKGPLTTPFTVTFKSNGQKSGTGFLASYTYINNCDSVCEEEFEDWARAISPKLGKDGLPKKDTTCTYTIKKKPDAKCLKIDVSAVVIKSDGTKLEIDGTVYDSTNRGGTATAEVKKFALNTDGEFPEIKLTVGATPNADDKLSLIYTQLTGEGNNCDDVSCGRVRNGPMVTLRNPGYPGKYPSKYKCIFEIVPFQLSTKVTIFLRPPALPTGDCLKIGADVLEPNEDGKTVATTKTAPAKISFESDGSDESTFEIVVIHIKP